MAGNVGGIKLSRTGRREGSPAPTQNYSPGDTGINTPPDPDDYFGDSGHRPGGDNPGDGDDDGDGDDNDPNPPPKENRDDQKKPRKDKKKGGNPPGSGPPDDDGDDDPKSDDSDDEKFRRRMIKFLGGSIESKTR